MPDFSINSLKARLRYDGARPSLFQVRLTNPIAPLADVDIPWMIKSASIPPSDGGTIVVPFMGRQIKYGGDRTFSEWTVTIINDEDFKVRNAMESWSNAINSHVTNTRAYAREYKSDGDLMQLGKDGKIIRQYTFQGMFPTSVSDIQLGWEMQDQIEEFTVTFQFDHWVVSGGSSGNSTN